MTPSLPARTKQIRLAAELLIRQYGMVRTTILQPTMIYGTPGNRKPSRLLPLLRRVSVLQVPGGGPHLQQTVHVSDPAESTLAAVARSTAAGNSYDVGCPAPLKSADLLRISAGRVSSRVWLVPVPPTSVVTAARRYVWLGRRLRIWAEQLQRLAGDKPFAIDDAVRNLGHALRLFADRILTEVRALGLAW